MSLWLLVVTILGFGVVVVLAQKSGRSSRCC